MERENGLKFWNELTYFMQALSVEEQQGFRYMEGCYKSPAFNSINGLPPIYAEVFRKMNFTYDAYDCQVFASISMSEGVGWHTDPDNVLILALYGNPVYKLGDGEHTIQLMQGQTLFIPKNKKHIGLGSMYPRIVFSSATPQSLTEDEVDFHYSKITGEHS